MYESRGKFGVMVIGTSSDDQLLIKVRGLGKGDKFIKKYYFK